ncbi:MAG: hypothetical protein IID32_08305, partial [Planctomycetes bacterium]|nr:hypothetical protein [Planctomycetota bacterium]
MDRNLNNVPGSPPGPRRVSVPQMTARDIIGILHRRIWLIVIVIIMVTVLSVALWMVLLIFNPKFTSTGFIQVRMPVREDVLATVALIPRADIIDLETKRKARQLTSDSFLISLMSEPKVSILETKWYEKYKKNPTDRLDFLKRSFKAVALQAEGLIRVSMTTSDRLDAQTILEVALRQFQNEIKDVADTSLASELTSLTAQRKEISDKISNRRGQLRAIHQGIDIPGWQSGNSPILQELMILGQERLRLQAVLLEVSSRAEWLEAELTDNSYSSTVLSAVDDDGMILSFRNQISSLEVERERLLRKFGQDHDQVKNIVTTLEGLQAQLAGREEKLQEQYAKIERTELDRTFQEYTQALEAVDMDISSASARQADVEQKLADYLALTQEITDLNRQLERYENKINATSTLKRDPSHVHISALSYGEDP